MTVGNGNDGSGVAYEDVRVGDRFSRTITITETHLVLGAGLIGDFNPHHVDETYARRSRYGTRILHGMLTGSMMGAAVGMHFHGTAIGYLEHNVRFLAPVRAGDTVASAWVVTGLSDKPKHDGGIVELEGQARNQDGVVVAEAVARILVARSRPATVEA